MKINYEFKNKSLLETALTHISYANERKTESNQRLEFLGDSILSFVVAEYIYDKHRECDEGKLTEIRAAAVCERSLSEVAAKLGLGEALKLGKAEGSRGGTKPSILCDTYEAVLGAIYLDSDIETAREWIMGNLKENIKRAENMDFTNYKSAIQNYFQKRDKCREVVGYRLVEKTGPDHMPTFRVEAIYKGNVIGTGEGRNLKAAEQMAAKEAYESVEK